ncbi:MAG TPA: response regulator [Candidatus Acidoferrum sp.]|nr:response regulator [Candidatus Acidoferrum sp.]
MSETTSFPPVAEANGPAKRTPTVYFIDDSATMREVIKIAFRRENITVITAGDAVSAMAQFDQNPPDAVITDVIMPDQDGYSVCSHIKRHERFGRTPVILMSGVVNKNVADKAVSVGADELIRKPFQPVDLIARVKSFLEPKSAQPSASPAPAPRLTAPSPLSSLFAAQPPTKAPATPLPAIPAAETPRESPWPAALASAFQPQTPAASFPPAGSVSSGFPAVQQQPVRPPAGDIQKLKTEISRLELLIKKLQTELQIERQYNQALELHVKSLTALD